MEQDLIAYVYVDKVEINDGEYNAHLRVIEAFKGDETEIQSGWRPICCGCEYQFKEDSVHLLYVSNYGKYWTASDFGPSKELKNVTARDLKYLHKYSNR